MKRYALWILVASVAISALLGCAALLVGGFGVTQGKVLFSTLVIAGASLLAMVCGVALERPASAALAKVGVTLAILTAPVLLLAVWGEIGASGFWRAAGSLEVTAVSVAHASLLLRASLRPAHRWMLAITLGGSALLTALLLGIVWDAMRDASVWRPLGILSILTSAGTILVWVFHRIDRGPPAAAGAVAGVASGGAPAGPPPPPPTSSRPLPPVRHCVACGADRIEVTARGVDCYACGAHFRVTPG